MMEVPTKRKIGNKVYRQKSNFIGNITGEQLMRSLSAKNIYCPVVRPVNSIILTSFSLISKLSNTILAKMANWAIGGAILAKMANWAKVVKAVDCQCPTLPPLNHLATLEKC